MHNFQRTTVSLAVIMFELTDTLTYAVPVMLAVLVAKTVADALEPKGIYDLVIDVQQLPYLDAKHTYLWGNVQVGDVLRRDVPAIKLDEKQTVESLRDMLVKASASGDGGGWTSSWTRAGRGAAARLGGARRRDRKRWAAAALTADA